MIAKKSEAKLDGLHPDLVRVIKRAAGTTDFVITEGLRTIETQRRYVADGKSKTLNSRHIRAKNGYGHAIDIYPVVNGQTIMDWSGGHFQRLASAVKAAAKEEGVPIEWGGDWKSFKDGPHWQLPWKPYDGNGAASEVADNPRYVKGGLEGVNSKPLAKSRTAAASGAMLLVGLGQTAKEAQTALEQAQEQISTGTWIGLAIGAVVIIGAAVALYARWDDAGRPLPWSG